MAIRYCATDELIGNNAAKGAFTIRVALATMQIAAVDSATKERAPGHANDSAGRAVATIVEGASDQPTDGAPNDQAGGSVTAMAVIMAVMAAPDRVARSQGSLRVIAGRFGAPFVLVVPILVMMLAPAMGRCPRRGIGKCNGSWQK
jgi:hypothetical protein